MGSAVRKDREMILKARILRWAAVVFAIAGLVVFLILYARNVDGNFFSALTDPFIVAIILVPFLPAAVLSWLARRLERKVARNRKQR